MPSRKRECACGNVMGHRSKKCRACFPFSCVGRKASRAKYSGKLFTLLEYDIIRTAGVDASELNRWETEKSIVPRKKSHDLFKRLINRDPWTEPLTDQNRAEVDKKLLDNMCMVPFLCLREKTRKVKPWESSVCDNCKVGYERIVKYQVGGDIRKIA